MDNNNNKLKDLLGKTGRADDLPEDDFEKEALEGFAMLENEEALALKNELDARMHKEVLATEKPKRSYWLAAAALVLVIGFSVYFIRNSSTAEPNRVAIITPPKNEVPAPAASEINTTTPQEKKADLKSPAKNTPVMPQTYKPAMTKDADEKSAAEPVPEEAAPAKKMKRLEKAAAPEQDRLAAAPPAAPPQTTDDEKEINITAANVSADKNTDAKKAVATTPEITIHAAPMGVATSVTRSEALSYNASPPPRMAAPKVQVIEASCTYAGGDAALQKDVKEKLTAQMLVQKFDAVLFIDKTNHVEKVTLTKTGTLTKTQEEQLIAVLKSLQKFTVNATAKKPVEYTLLFRP